MSEHMQDQAMKKAFVIGFPISHSKSPIIHNHWLREHQLTGIYEKIAVDPKDLKDFIRQFKQQNYQGGNVTIPHKEAVLDHVDVIHPTAKRLQAANTLWLQNGQIHADNTDGYGFLANIDQNKPYWHQNDPVKQALILGAGGASRPIIDGLLERGFDITVTNRTRERSEAIVELFIKLGYQDHIKTIDWQDRNKAMTGQSLLVNTTALGMSGQPKLDIDLSDLPKTALVTDIVYTPLKTDLLLQAQERGNPNIDGLGMLLHQAVPGFEKWFGPRPKVSEYLRNLVLNA
ncbi:MAG: shikimate dehydrogenase [Cohaesibacter sp.]|nr:shikimate dehydrogenase [Cohaesibacter sp.]